MKLSKRLFPRLLLAVILQHLDTCGALAHEPCDDTLEDCSYYFNTSGCENHKRLTRHYCARTCGHCQIPPPTSQPECRDLLSDCATLIGSPMQCQSAKGFFTKYCPRTCGFCVCEDVLPDCLKYISNSNQCKLSLFFAKYCRRSCSFCEDHSTSSSNTTSSITSMSTSTLPPSTKPSSPTESSTPPPPAPDFSSTTSSPTLPSEGCSDVLPECPSKVKKDPESCADEHMKENCPESCKLCDGDCEDKMPKDCMNLIARDKESCKTKTEFMRENCARSCDYCGCSDLLAICPALVQNNKDYCDSNRFFMKTNCPKSCDFCGDNIVVKPPTQEAVNDCVDKQKRCKQYASYKNYCRYHGQFMTRYCPKACQFCEKEYNFSIRTEWNGGPINHAPITIQISAQDSNFVRIRVSGPFFDDPGPPPCKVGSACDGLWNYEVAEVFFLGKKEKYLEVELSPHGQHLLLLLNGVRKKFMDKVPIEYSATINRANNTWTGTAKIPIDYFPPDVTKINAYAIHGSGVNRRYESLYPASSDVSNPDFHRLEFFKPFDLEAMFTMSWSKPLSPFWKNVMKRIMRARAKAKAKV